MNWLSKYASISWISARSNLAYFGDVASRFVFLAVILFIFLCLWKVTYAETKSTYLGGLSLKEMLWYLVMTEAIVMSGPRVAQAVDEDVRTGSLAVQLIRPMSYPLYRLGATLGERIVRFLMNLSVGSILALIFVGPLTFTSVSLLSIGLTVPLAFILDFLVNFLIGLGAFWLEDTSGLVLLYSRITMILGGVLIPVELFPDQLKPLIQILPFTSIVWGPAHLVVQPDILNLVAVMTKQLVTILVFGIVIWFVWRQALTRIFSNGG